MQELIDFTHCKRMHANFGGSDRKFGVEYNGDRYMLKFSDKRAKKSDISTSYVNNVVSEYICSHISQSVGLPTHETVLGTYNDEIVVGCKDFRETPDTINVEFGEYVHASYDSSDINRIIKLDQIYHTLQDPNNNIPPAIQKQTIERYWETFVVDALVGNFDRHTGNWGYLVKDNALSLAPVYDYGSTLFPQLSDEGAVEFIDKQYEMMKRSLVFPSPALAITDEKVGKVGYYDMLGSNYDAHCTTALLKMTPRINMKDINQIIDETPLITDVRKQFYKAIINLRKELIIDRAFVRCANKEYDQDSIERLTDGHQFSEKDLEKFIVARNQAEQAFLVNEENIQYTKTSEYVKRKIFDSSFNPIDEKSLYAEQRMLVEEYGFHSESILEKSIQKAKNMERDDFSR